MQLHYPSDWKGAFFLYTCIIIWRERLLIKYVAKLAQSPACPIILWWRRPLWPRCGGRDWGQWMAFPWSWALQGQLRTCICLQALIEEGSCRPLPPVSLLLYFFFNQPDHSGPPCLVPWWLKHGIGESTEQCLSHQSTCPLVDLIHMQILSGSRV